MKVLLLLAPVIQLILGAGKSEKPCSATQDEQNCKCVDSSCFNTYLPRFKRETHARGVRKIPKTYAATVQFTKSQVQVEIKFIDNQNDCLANRENAESCLSPRYNDGSAYPGTTFNPIGFRRNTFRIKDSEIDSSEAGYNTDMIAIDDMSLNRIIENIDSYCSQFIMCQNKIEATDEICTDHVNFATTQKRLFFYMHTFLFPFLKIPLAEFEKKTIDIGESLKSKANNIKFIHFNLRLSQNIHIRINVKSTLLVGRRTILGASAANQQITAYITT